MSQCLFIMPWQGQCKNEAAVGLCCEEHAKMRCQVCGEQATTLCQASIGVMCGIPLCDLCGAGGMCLAHASRGPLAVIRALLGAGPIPSVFATQDMLKAKAAKMKASVVRLQEQAGWCGPSMAAFDAQVAKWDAEAAKIEPRRFGSVHDFSKSAGLLICVGCDVKDGSVHRCCGQVSVGGGSGSGNRPCECPECRSLMPLHPVGDETEKTTEQLQAEGFTIGVLPDAQVDGRDDTSVKTEPLAQ